GDLVEASGDSDSFEPFRIIDPSFSGPPIGVVRGWKLYLPYLIPIDLIVNPREYNLLTPEFTNSVEQTVKQYITYSELVQEDNLRGILGEVITSFYILSNLSGLAESYYQDALLPQISQALGRVGWTENVVSGIGTPDSFFQNDPQTASDVLEDFLSSYSDGLCISIYPERPPDVSMYMCGKHLTSGVSRQTFFPCESVVKITRTSEILEEFQELLQRQLSEAQWEAFLKHHYQEIFGPYYDRIETQVWLRLPEIDPEVSGRRIDLFLRNAVAGDWELVELKRPSPIFRSKRSIPGFCAEVNDAIQQIKHYDRILRSDSVRKRLAEEGIEYYEPELKVVIGRRPSIPQKDWRWLLKSCDRDVKLITYDCLIEEMKARIS
ncbi:MAG TPA: Shedu anti-phage system protein SduA domain-containing protein, partial [Candidatus Obscuribacterales bacterium]